MKSFFSILFCSLFLFMHAQVEWKNPNFRQKKISVKDTIVLDSLPILPEKLSIKKLDGTLISKEHYYIHQNTLILKPYQVLEDSLEVTYYIHPHFKKKITYPKDPSLIVPSPSESSALVLGNKEKEEVELFNGLNAQGTLVRGLMFGNNQGSSVQSSLNLQLDGKLSQDVGVKAFISDTNAPIEVDGYTQSLDQFERLFIELYTKSSTIRAGHIDLEQNDDYFGKFQRKVTGLQLSHTLKSENSTTVFEAAGSLGRGQYTQDEFVGIEGNQGPYRLRGNSNEAYVLIISGSERVYRNGKLLTQGEDKDYVLNYATGEILFTTQHLVTANDRFIVEYQYTNRNYNRYTWFAGAEHQGERFGISGHVYTETDNKNNPINQNLTAEELQILAQAGNNTSKLFTDSAIPSEYQEDRVLYKKLIVNGVTIYEYSVDPNDALYQVSFTYLGPNQGDYVQSTSGVNGRVFNYVAPVNGISQGDYAPVKPLVAPERKQVISLASHYLFGNDGRIRVDVGLSNNDANLFSKIDDKENIGLGLRLNGEKSMHIGQFKIIPSFNYEFIQDKFAPIERLRQPEFARDFNLNQELEPLDQQFLETNFALMLSDSSKLNYGLDYLHQKNNYTGVRHRLSAKHQFNQYTMGGEGSYLHTSHHGIESEFLRYNAGATKVFKNILLEAGINGESRRNLVMDKDSLSFRWNELYATARLGDSLQRYLQIRAYARTDDSTRLKELLPYSQSWGTQLKSRLINSTQHSLVFLTDFRRVHYQFNADDASFLNASVQWRKSFLNDGLHLHVNYGLSGNTEQQRAFAYARVADGMGIYKWVDFNQDGVQQIDEFEVAEFTDEANYIRVYTNVVNALRTNQNQAGLNMSLHPSKFLKTDFWKRIQSRVVYQVGGNYLKNNKMAAWNPFKENSDMRSRNEQFYIKNEWNKGKSYQWHFTHEFKTQENAHLIFTGMESLKNRENKLNIQYDINQFLMVELTQQLQKTTSESESFASRRFVLGQQYWSPQLNIQLNQNLKSSLAYIYRKGENQTGPEHLKAQQFNFTLTWDNASKTSVYAHVDWVKNNFIGNQDNLIANRMMMGLKKGNNLVWNLNFSRNINSFMVLDVRYNGRKNENLKAIHSGNMQIRLNF